MQLLHSQTDTVRASLSIKVQIVFSILLNLRGCIAERQGRESGKWFVVCEIGRPLSADYLAK